MTVRYFAIPLFFSMLVFTVDDEVTIDGKTQALAEGVELQGRGGVPALKKP